MGTVLSAGKGVQVMRRGMCSVQASGKAVYVSSSCSVCFYRQNATRKVVWQVVEPTVVLPAEPSVGSSEVQEFSPAGFPGAKQSGEGKKEAAA